MDTLLILHITIDIHGGYPVRISILDKNPWFRISSCEGPRTYPTYPYLSWLILTYPTYPLRPSFQMLLRILRVQSYKGKWWVDRGPWQNIEQREKNLLWYKHARNGIVRWYYIIGLVISCWLSPCKYLNRKSVAEIMSQMFDIWSVHMSQL